MFIDLHQEITTSAATGQGVGLDLHVCRQGFTADSKGVCDS